MPKKELLDVTFFIHNRYFCSAAWDWHCRSKAHGCTILWLGRRIRVHIW